MLTSPNELHKAACEHYLEGGKPVDDDEWELCVNFWAFNIDLDVTIDATVLMAKILDCPLSEDQVREIAEFLRRTESFREVAESIPHLVWTARLDGVNEYFNRKALEFFGRSLDMIRPDAWLDSVHPDDRPPLREAMRQFLRTGEFEGRVIRLQLADGRLRHAQLQCISARDAAGASAKRAASGSPRTKRWSSSRDRS